MRFCIRLSALVLSVFCLSVPVFALSDTPDISIDDLISGSQEVLDHTEELLDMLESTDTDIRDEEIGDEDIEGESSQDEELQDEDIEEDDSPLAPMILYAPAPSVLNGDVFLDIPDNPPSNAPFYGQWYISGLSGNQRVIIYTPNNDNGWGVDDNGYLVRLGSSASGQLYLNGSIPNSVQMSAYSYPRYRTGTTGNTYIDLHIVPDSSNVNIYSAFPNKDNLLGFTVPDYCLFFAVGMVCVILLTRKR